MYRNGKRKITTELLQKQKAYMKNQTGRKITGIGRRKGENCMSNKKILI